MRRVRALCIVALAAVTFGMSLWARQAPSADDAIDFNRARALIQRQRSGQPLTPDEQAYLDRARAARGALNSQAAPSSPAGGGDAAAIDFDYARGLIQRQRSGQQLTPDEQSYLERARGARRGGQPLRNPNNRGGALLPKEFLDLTPLTDLQGDARYKGMDGGLYGGGSNEPPAPLASRAREAAARVRPLDGAGAGAVDGRIVLLSIGMSNTTQEFSRFKSQADQDPARKPAVLIVDGAQGGMDAQAWANGAAWSNAEQRLRASGATNAQVQVLWIKQAISQPAVSGDFPRHTDMLAENLRTILRLAESRFPNLQLVFFSSRIYAGFAASMLNPEPYAYESAFAVRQVLLDQNDDGAVLLWGPYLWADGVKGRPDDALVWTREDFNADGTHPSDSGRAKVAAMLLEFFKTNNFTRTWFTAN